MTRTARRSRKKEALPATPWEELSGVQSHQDDRPLALEESQRGNLKLTRRKKLGPRVSKRAKLKLKRLTARRLFKEASSDVVSLLDSTQLSESASLNGTEEPNTSQHETTETVRSSKKRKKRKEVSAGNLGTSLETDATSVGSRKNRRTELASKSVQSKKSRRLSEDKVSLIRQWNSESSLSDQGEVWSGREVESECESGDVGESCENGDNEADISSHAKDSSTNASSKKVSNKNRRKTRVKIGKKWVKAKTQPPPTSRGTGNGGDGETRWQGDGPRGKRRRPMDEESRQKRIEHRKLRRQRKKVCFNCRQPGHWVGDCPRAASSAGICFKCGSSEHSCWQCKAKVPSGEYPYAKCFICGEMGHLTRSCPDNPRGLYPRGGGCKVCGSVEHLKANCPSGKDPADKTTSFTTGGKSGFGVSSTASADALEDMETTAPTAAGKKPTTNKKLLNKIVTF